MTIFFSITQTINVSPIQPFSVYTWSHLSGAVEKPGERRYLTQHTRTRRTRLKAHSSSKCSSTKVCTRWYEWATSQCSFHITLLSVTNIQYLGSLAHSTVQYTVQYNAQYKHTRISWGERYHTSQIHSPQLKEWTYEYELMKADSKPRWTPASRTTDDK